MQRAKKRGDEAAVREITQLLNHVRSVMEQDFQAQEGKKKPAKKKDPARRKRDEHEAKLRIIRQRIMERTHPVAGTRLRICNRHTKATYLTEVHAHDAMLDYFKQGGDPGALVYRCKTTRGWHFGHPGGWKSLERIINESAGDTGLLPLTRT